jgi:hypothetical protein
VLDEALQRVEPGAFRRDRDAAAEDYPLQLCADFRSSASRTSFGTVVRPSPF